MKLTQVQTPAGHVRAKTLLEGSHWIINQKLQTGDTTIINIFNTDNESILRLSLTSREREELKKVL